MKKAVLSIARRMPEGNTVVIRTLSDVGAIRAITKVEVGIRDFALALFGLGDVKCKTDTNKFIMGVDDSRFKE